MPTYHYRCSKCEQHLEVVQSMTDDPVTTCAACGGAMQKVLKPVGIVLKGSGFYRTDSRSSPKKSGSTATGGNDTGSRDTQKRDSGKSDSEKTGKTDSGSSSKGSSDSSNAGGSARAKSA